MTNEGAQAETDDEAAAGTNDVVEVGIDDEATVANEAEVGAAADITGTVVCGICHFSKSIMTF